MTSHLSHQPAGHITSEPFKILICTYLVSFTYLNIHGNNQVTGGKRVRHERKACLCQTQLEVAGGKSTERCLEQKRNCLFRTWALHIRALERAVNINLKANHVVWPLFAFWTEVLETIPYHPRVELSDPSPAHSSNGYYHSVGPTEPCVCTCLHPRRAKSAEGRWDYCKRSKDNPRQGLFIQEKSPSSRHHGSAQSPLNNSRAAMLQRLNLVRNSMLCRPDVACSKLEREGQVEGGGGRRRRGKRDKRQHILQSFC